MALDDPNDPYAPPVFDEAAFLAAMAGGQVAPVELDPSAPIVPPLPAAAAAPAPEQLAQPIAPPAEEAAKPVLPPPPEESKPEEPPPYARPVEAPPVVQLPFAADATSGVDQAPPPEAAVSTAPIPTERPLEELTPEHLGEYYSSLPVEEQEKKRAEIEGAKQNFATTRLLDESRRTREQAEANARAYEQSVRQSMQQAADLDAEAKRVADRDPIGDIPLHKKLLGVLAAFIGGFAMNKTGRNIGMEAVDDIINQAVSQQKLKLNQIGARKSALSDQLARSGDLYHATETVRLAAYDNVIKNLEAEVQNYDPRGTTALRVMDAIGQAKARRAELLAKYQTEQQKRIEAVLKEQRERAQLLETQRHNMAQEKTAQTSAYADLLRAKTDKQKADAETSDAPLSVDQLRSMGINIPEGAALPPMTLKRAKQIAETAKSVEDWTKAARENSPEQQAVAQSVAQLTDVNGKPLKFIDNKKVASAFESSDNAVRLLDELISLREQFGGSTDLMKSPEWRKAWVKYSNLLLNQKTRDELGALTGSDIELESKKLGTTDPTEWRDPRPGLLEARSQIVEGMNTMLRTQASGQTPKRWEPPRPPPPPPKSPLQGTVQSILTFDPDRPTKQESAELGGPGAIEAAGGDVVPPSYRDAIDRLAAVFNDPNAADKEREEAGAHLESLKNQAKSPSVRQYATQAALTAGMSSIPVPGGLE